MSLSYRFRRTPWCQKMRDDSMATFAKLEDVKVVVPQPCSDGESLDPENGYTPHGMVSNLDEGEAVAKYTQGQRFLA